MRKLLVLIVLLAMLVLPAQADVAVLDGKEIDLTAERLDLSGTRFTSGLEALEEILLQMPNLTYADLSSCGFQYADLAELRARFEERGVKIVWTVYFGRWSCRTDATAFSTLNDSKTSRVGEKDLDPLKYCTELQAIDLGHNWIFDISFLSEMDDLRVVVLSDNRITDLTPLDNKPLEYLEMFNNRVNDISFLADCDTLIDLNLCNTHIADLSPLYNLPNLKRVWMGDIDELTQGEINTFLSYQQDKLEDYNFFTKYPTEYGWRKHERYEIIKALFKEGVYMDFDTVLREDQYVRLNKRY